jgi:hypothetical protein
VTPPELAVHVVGVDFAPVSLKPRETEPPAGICPFQASLPKVNVPLRALPTAFHGETLVPSHGSVTVQPLMAVVPVLRTSMETVRPLPQSEDTLIVTESRAVAGEADVEGDGVADGATVGVATGVGVGEGATPATRPAQ